MLMRFIILPALVLASLVAPAGAQSEDTSAAPSNDDINRLIARLASDSFEYRETATRQLIVLGKPAIPLLQQAADGGEPEMSWRAVFALVELALSTDVQTVAQAEKALIELSQSTNETAAHRACDAVVALPFMRETRAITALNNLGANVSLETNYIELNGNWKGGDAGLKHLTLLRNVKQVSIEPTANVSDEAVTMLQQALPGAKIIKFGEAFLGVGTLPADDGPGLRVHTVLTGGAAEKAGLQVNDVIYQIDGKPVNEFDDLVKSIAKKTPGDAIEIDYFSSLTGQRKKVKAELGKREKK
ncbi:MAG: PDZ domain-containing protein [Phycisphaeraceae bacterium]